MFPEIYPCNRHDSILRLEFERALNIAQVCPDCTVEYGA